MSRYRITVRGDGVELRGTLTAGNHRLSEFATAMQPFGLVIASEVGRDDANLEDWAREKEESERRDGGEITGLADVDLTLQRLRTFQQALRAEDHYPEEGA